MYVHLSLVSVLPLVVVCVRVHTLPWYPPWGLCASTLLTPSCSGVLVLRTPPRGEGCVYPPSVTPPRGWGCTCPQYASPQARVLILCLYTHTLVVCTRLLLPPLQCVCTWLSSNLCVCACQVSLYSMCFPCCLLYLLPVCVSSWCGCLLPSIPLFPKSFCSQLMWGQVPVGRAVCRL